MIFDLEASRAHGREPISYMASLIPLRSTIDVTIPRRGQLFRLGETPCPSAGLLQGLIDDEDLNVKKLWVHAIISHPVAYASTAHAPNISRGPRP
jgi:hypothetical protein